MQDTHAMLRNLSEGGNFERWKRGGIEKLSLYLNCFQMLSR
jgi:hypothetical protein